MLEPYVPWNDPRFEAARAVQRRSGPIDLHVDSILQQRLFGYAVRKRHGAGIRSQPFIWHADVPRMRDASYGGACLGIHYFPWDSEGAWREAQRQIDYLDRIAGADPELLRAFAPSDWERARREGKLAIAPGVEGAHMLNGRIERVAELARRGVVYLTLAHFSKNAACTPSLGRGANEVEGLTDFGRKLVRELNRWGIVVDVAHVNTPGTLEICRTTEAPLLCTHTGVKGVFPSRRNITDEEIDAIAAIDGAIGIMCAPSFLAGRLFVDSRVFCDHVDYIVERVGHQHVCLGSDYDGWIPLFSDHKDCRDVVKITDELMRRGYTDEQLELFFRGNALRVIEAAWRAGELNRERSTLDSTEGRVP